MFIELVRDGKGFELFEKVEGKKPSPIAHVDTAYYPEALLLAQAEAKRRGDNWAVINKADKNG